MSEAIKTLIELQEIDRNIYELGEIRKSLSIKTTKWRQLFTKKEDDYKKMLIEIDLLKKDLRHKKGSLQIIEDGLKKYQSQIYSIKTEKEMVALEHEIKKSHQARITIEEDMLNLEITLEELEKKGEETKKDLSEEEIKLIEAEKANEKLLKDNDEKLADIKHKRDECIKKITPGLVTLYQKLLINKNNLAIVPVKNGICQGCFMSLPHQIVSELRMKQGIIQCGNCIRILYPVD